MSCDKNLEPIYLPLYSSNRKKKKFYAYRQIKVTLLFASSSESFDENENKDDAVVENTTNEHGIEEEGLGTSNDELNQ